MEGIFELTVCTGAIFFGSIIFFFFIIHWEKIKFITTVMLKNSWFFSVVPLFLIFWSGIITIGTCIVYPLKIFLTPITFFLAGKEDNTIVITGKVKEIIQVPSPANNILFIGICQYFEYSDLNLFPSSFYLIIIEISKEEEVSIKFYGYPPLGLIIDSMVQIVCSPIGENRYKFVNLKT